MEKDRKLGMNRTGIDMSPLQSKEMIEGAANLTKAPPGSDAEISQNRIRYIQESDPVGSIPLPGTVKGALKTGIQMIQGNRPTILLDKLGARLAFERAGVRLYESLISKHEASPDKGSLPPIETLRKFRSEELQHFHLLDETIRKLGADPTAQTPSADLDAVAAMGIQKVVTDSRTGFADTLHAILIAELADHDGWKMLIRLVDEAGLKDVSQAFQKALQEEDVHLSSVRQWMEQLTLGQLDLAKKIA